jgi:hypothetical protein
MLIFGAFLIAGMANPSPDPVTMLILGGTCRNGRAPGEQAG